MVSTRAIARLGIMAVGLGIGAALASTPGIATADSSTDWLSSIDTLLSGGALSAADTSDTNLAISIDGVTVLQEGSATASSGTDGDFAIASGADTTATADGTSDFASAYGTDSSATISGAGSTFDSAFVDGDSSNAEVVGTAEYPATFDSALIFGNDNGADVGSTATSAGDYSVAYVEGNDLGTANALGTDYMLDIVKTYEDGMAAATSAAADGTLGTDLLSSLDGGSLAADASSLWTDLTSLF